MNINAFFVNSHREIPVLNNANTYEEQIVKQAIDNSWTSDKLAEEYVATAKQNGMTKQEAIQQYHSIMNLYRDIKETPLEVEHAKDYLQYSILIAVLGICFWFILRTCILYILTGQLF